MRKIEFEVELTHTKARYLVKLTEGCRPKDSAKTVQRAVMVFYRRSFQPWVHTEARSRERVSCHSTEEATLGGGQSQSLSHTFCFQESKEIKLWITGGHRILLQIGL